MGWNAIMKGFSGPNTGFEFGQQYEHSEFYKGHKT